MFSVNNAQCFHFHFFLFTSTLNFLSFYFFIFLVIVCLVSLIFCFISLQFFVRSCSKTRKIQSISPHQVTNIFLLQMGMGWWILIALVIIRSCGIVTCNSQSPEIKEFKKKWPLVWLWPLTSIARQKERKRKWFSFYMADVSQMFVKTFLWCLCLFQTNATWSRSKIDRRFTLNQDLFSHFRYRWFYTISYTPSGNIPRKIYTQAITYT